MAEKNWIAPITPERRQQILAKDLLTIEDFCQLLGVPYQTGAKIIREIKKNTDRIKMSGFLHIQDYLEYYNLPAERYGGTAKIKGGAMDYDTSRAN